MRLEGDSVPDIITSEDVTDEVVAAHAQQGYALTFAEDVMRYDLSDPSRPLPHLDLPFAVTYLEWTPERASDFFAVYEASFRERPGFPGWSETEWVQWTAGDPTFRPDLSLLAVFEGRAVGFLTSANYEDEQARCGLVIQVGVHPAWRGQKLGAALIIRSLQDWRSAGKEALILDVNVNNPGAKHLYLQLGFLVVRRRGKFSRSAT
jgi:ribosomal protein S18 acetylase RimI-like enzyme